MRSGSAHARSAGCGPSSGSEWRRAHPALPLFLVPLADGRELLYAPPGRFAPVGPGEAECLERIWRGEPCPAAPGSLAAVERWCQEAGRAAEDRWRELAREPFAPECLTVSLGRGCSCRCRYCFVGRGAPEPAFSWQAAEAAARLVAAACRARGKPFSLAVHGGGEPTLHWDRLTRIHALGVETAERFGLEFCGYVATNGLLAEEKARWLGASFGRVGLSCDGPPEIHDAQRPRADESGTSRAVARTAAAVKKAGGRLTVRATITPGSMRRQEAVAEYLCRELSADDLAFEPWFGVAGNPGPFAAEDAEAFAQHFVSAQAVAASHGRELSFAGVRLDELHGPFCDSARHALRLLPDGRALDCFAAAGQAGPWHAACEVGRFDAGRGVFRLDEQRLAELRERALALPEGCRGCANLLHCSRGCPEACPVAGEAGRRREFRCRLHRALTRRWLADAARRARQPDREAITVGAPTATRRRPLESRSLPRPPWELHGYSLAGREARKRIAEEARRAQAPISIYVHIPFCDRRCGFCDCLSRPKRGQDEEAFAGALLTEAAAWRGFGRIGSAPITTVHFGGGTPNCLAGRNVERIVGAISEAFNVDGSTELALETTVGRATPADLAFLRSLGFTRLHLGVQTFDDRLRRRIGRRHGGREARAAVENALAAGWTTSIDLLFGLPGQGPDEVLRSVEEAVDAGVHGVSLYRFNRSSRNSAFARRALTTARDARGDFEAFRAAEELLTGAGYAKNHVTHYALPPDRNLYYTHADRGETLIALGPTADGAVGDWIYRHGGLKAYLAADIGETLGLEGCLKLLDRDRAVAPLAASLWCGRAEPRRYEETGLGDLLRGWVETGWLRPDDRTGDFRLAAAGSWFIDRMLEQLAGARPGAAPEPEDGPW